MNWKRTALWSGVVFVWLVTFGCWFLGAYLGRGYRDWGAWWAGWAWMGVDAVTGIGAIGITACACWLEESSK